jgi:glycosyltransferase involved in cell wall biosynthesis
MRTLQIGDRWFAESQGGLSRYYFELLRHLPQQGVEVRGLTVGHRDIAASTGDTVHPFAAPDAPLFARLRALRRAALREISKFQPDLLVSHFAIYSLPLLDRLSHSRNVVHFHGPWAGESDAEGQANVEAGLKAYVEGLVYRRATRTIVLSNAFRKELVERYKVDESKVRVVAGGIDIERFNDSLTREEARDRLGLPLNRPTVLCVRRQVRRMGLENLIEAAAAISRRLPDILILIAGTGPLAEELAQLICERSLEKNVRLLGRIADDDLPLLYRAADLSIVPTIALEGFGIITLESLASGTPVLVTPVGGLPEVVEPLASSCILEGSSPAQLADGISRALEGKLNLPTSAECRRYAIENFSWPAIAENIANVYREALAHS